MHVDEPSLLNHLDQIRGVNIPEGGLTNILICSKVKNDSSIQLVLDLHRQVVENEVSETTNLTGILLGQGNSILHFLEGPSFVILKILSELARDIDQCYGRVVYCVEDRPMRLYADWYCGVIDEKKSVVDDVSNETCVEIVHDLATSLLKVGRGIQSDYTEGEVELGRYGEHLPGKSLILSLSASTLFFNIKEFIEMYGESNHLDLESEQSWPLQPLVRYS